MEFSETRETKPAQSQKLSKMTTIEWKNAAEQKRTECRNTSEIAITADAAALANGITCECSKTSEEGEISDSKIDLNQNRSAWKSCLSQMQSNLRDQPIGEIEVNCLPSNPKGGQKRTNRP
jgi:hypothetical protein